jgi:hypothetical protein
MDDGYVLIPSRPGGGDGCGTALVPSATTDKQWHRKYPGGHSSLARTLPLAHVVEN